MKLIVGLGNPGIEYRETRHNIGFITIDNLLNTYQLELKVDQKLKSALVKTKINQEDVIIAKPLTYMNLSGDAVSLLMNYYKVDINDILIISDDIQLETGRMRYRKSGSHGGQNGLKDIILKLSSNQFKRLRIGIGMKTHIDMKDYVLGKFTKQEKEVLEQTIQRAVESIDLWIKNMSFDQIMTNYNTPQV